MEERKHHVYFPTVKLKYVVTSQENTALNLNIMFQIHCLSIYSCIYISFLFSSTFAFGFNYD